MVGFPGRAAFARTILCALAALAAAPAAAGSLTIDPVRVDLTGDRRIGAIRIVNRDDAPVALRVGALRWEQQGGEDVRRECADVIASPPIFTIPPGGAQLLRVGLRDGRFDGFRAWRLIVEEIPRAAAAPGEVKVALRLDLPLYAQPASAPAKPLRWALARDANGAPALEARNDGAAPVQVRAIEAVTPAGAPVVLSESMGVVLPGSMRRWRVEGPLPRGPAPLRLVARTDSGAQSAEIAVPAP